LFSDDIETAQDVGGWRKLSKEDFMALALRVEESKLEIEKENEELQPDELVQTAFQGETRLPPPGLTANMLPFQQEGLSWMYHQEVKVHDIRGGILADEMGMVRIDGSIVIPIWSACSFFVHIS
jgi:SNF2 family DNA or RNA helicase